MFIEILIYALIAAFLVFRLRSVLGRRTGEERSRPNPFLTSGQESGETLPSEGSMARPERTRSDEGPPPSPMPEMDTVSAGLNQIRMADPGFDRQHFLSGSTAAFAMIVEAFAKGDTATLRPLVSDDLYDEFSDAIRRRLAAGETLETRIDRVKVAEPVDARLEGRTAYVTVRFGSDQVNVTRDSQGNIVDGDPAAVVDVTDIWTFARNTRSPNPNWTLVETRTPG